MKFPQALRKEINLQRKSDWGFPFHCVSQTKLLNFTMSCVSASTQVQKLRKGTFFSSFPAHVEGSFCFLHTVSRSPHSRQTHMAVNPGQAHAALLLPHLKTFSTQLTTRLYEQCNFFRGMFFFWTLNNRLLTVPDLHSRPENCLIGFLSKSSEVQNQIKWKQLSQHARHTACPTDSTTTPYPQLSIWWVTTELLQNCGAG